MVEHSLSTQEPDAEHLITNPDTLRVYFDPMRTRILRTMVAQARTVHEIADELGVPFTRLYYHINMLEKHSLIRVVEVRSLSGAVEEKYYRVTAYRFIVDRALLSMRSDEPDNEAAQLAERVLLATHRDLLQSARIGLVDVRSSRPQAGTLLANRLHLQLTPTRANEFQKRLNALCAEFDHDPVTLESHPYAVTMAVFRSTDEDTPATTI